MKLNIAIQKKGRMSQDSINLLKSCGLKFNNSGRGLIAQSSGFPANIYYLRDDDIPDYVEDGIADVGIVGLNVVEEGQNDVRVSEHLGFARSEEHTSELQSRGHLVCRLLLEKKNTHE